MGVGEQTLCWRHKPLFLAVVTVLTGALLYAACFVLLIASNRRLRLFSGDIVNRDTGLDTLIWVFSVFPVVSLALATAVARIRDSGPSRTHRKSRVCQFTAISFLIVLNVVAAAVWNVVGFRSPQQFFEFVDLGSGCPDAQELGSNALPSESDFEEYCTLATNAFYSCYGALVLTVAGQVWAAIILLRMSKRHHH